MIRLVSSIVACVVLAGCSGPAPEPSAPAPTAASSVLFASPSPSASPHVGLPSAASPSPSALPTPTAAQSPAVAPTPAGTPAGGTSTIAGPLPENQPPPKQTTKPPVAGCGVSQSDVEPLYHTFARVVDSVGRPDQGSYTGPLVTLVDSLGREAADACPGGDLVQQMAGLARQIDQAAKDGNPDLDGINEFRLTGNEWLDTLGLLPSLLS